jgi:hypothetical protein
LGLPAFSVGVTTRVGLSRLAFFAVKIRKKELKQTAQSLTQIDLRFQIFDLRF